MVSGTAKALFPGQIYDLPDEIALAHDWLTVIETAEKALDGAPLNKAVAPQRNKSVRRGNP